MIPFILNIQNPQRQKNRLVLPQGQGNGEYKLVGAGVSLGVVMKML